MKKIYVSLVLLTSAVGAFGYRGDYQRTLDRAQFDRNRPMVKDRASYRQVRRGPVVDPMGESWQERTQTMEAENLAASMSDS